jgi:hypothetical protein
VPVAYPLYIGTILRADKRRTQPAAFGIAQPRRGLGYVQPVGTEPPVMWDVRWRFTQAEAVVFKLWFEVALERGTLEFTLPILTEFGLLDHTCLFLPGSLMDAGQNGAAWEYTATVMARAQVVPGSAPSSAGLTTAYPLSLRTILRQSKRRRQDAAFRVSDVRSGYAYLEATGTDLPVEWDVEFRFTRDEAALFQVWFRDLLDLGVQPFTLPIDTEFGLITHEVQFQPGGLLDASEDGETVRYSASIAARRLAIPQGYIDAALLIIALDDWQAWALALDDAISRALPES